MIDPNPYLGLPYAPWGRDRAGLDCWGLVRLVYREQLGIVLPSYADTQPEPQERQELAAIIRGNMGRWRPVASPADGDVHLFSVGGHPVHVAIGIGARQMMHVQEGGVVLLQAATDRPWSGRRVGIYRHRARP